MPSARALVPSARAADDADRRVRVSQVTYPSHLTFPNAVWARYAARYANQSSWSSVPAGEVLERVRAATGLPEEFLRTRSSAQRHDTATERR